MVHRGRMKTPYSEALLNSKYCIHAKGFEINTARIGDALYYGCVPVILADHYDLPYADILNWENFSVIVSSLDIQKLKQILHAIDYNHYVKLQNNVMQVKKHFLWNSFSKDFDIFHMVMYELWIRRSHLRHFYWSNSISQGQYFIFSSYELLVLFVYVLFLPNKEHLAYVENFIICLNYLVFTHKLDVML